MANFLIPIIAFAGLLLGVFLAFVVKEEIKPGRKYFVTLKNVIAIILIVCLFFSSMHKYTFFLIGILFGFVFKREYLYLGIALASAFLISKDLVLLVSVLIFLYGLPNGTMLKKVVWKKEVIISAILFFLPFVLFFFQSFKPHVFLCFASGSLLGSNPISDKIESFIKETLLYQK